MNVLNTFQILICVLKIDKQGQDQSNMKASRANGPLVLNTGGPSFFFKARFAILIYCIHQACTTSCSGVVSHRAPIKGIWVLANHQHGNKRKQNAPMIFAC